ncbi:MAG: uracil phosphoribosyltransferase [Oscillospiraceae bacterium]
MSGKIQVMNHPLITHKITLIRDKNTGYKEFRELVSEIATLMLYEATRDLELKEVEIETPICISKQQVVSGKKFVIVPILRAGLGMVDGLIRLLPTAKVGHIGMFRNHETFEPESYYCKMPDDIAESDVVVVDPMLATGGSAAAAVSELKKMGVKNIKFMCIVAAPEGLNTLSQAHQDIQIYAGTLDEKLNDSKYIVPGLGDAGDRIFGTK